MKFTMFAAAFAAAAAVSLAPGVANAETPPSGCTDGFGYQTTYTWANCTRGAGYVQAIATCSSGSYTKKVYGPWTYVGTQSSAHCPSTYPRAVAHAYNIRAY
ncbi:hypothetical protein ACIBHX_20385 [Nonomuraea sp. NPDC050536]|uniref:hypothetical protein n=1 Tax=Nonomuraea sp. NPDC050536 TaxID=3364366 RepID=UPI0037C50E45